MVFRPRVNPFNNTQFLQESREREGGREGETEGVQSMWVFVTISEYLLPLQIPTGKYLLRSLVFATVANTQVSICYGSEFGGWIFAPMGGYLLEQQIRREGICTQRQVFATAANKHSEYLLRLQLRYYPDMYFIAFFFGIRAKCTFVQ